MRTTRQAVPSTSASSRAGSPRLGAFEVVTARPLALAARAVRGRAVQVLVLVAGSHGDARLRCALAVETLARAALGRTVLVRVLHVLAASLRDRVHVLKLRWLHHHPRI